MRAGGDRRRMIFHIGLPRAGSTTVQHLMARLRPELDGAGILYPELTPGTAAEPHLNHLALGEALDGRRRAEEAEAILSRLSDAMAASRADVAMLSYEGFCQQKRAPEILRVLRALCDRHGFRMEAIMVVRPQSEYLNSLYSHAMQFLRERRSFGAFVRGFWQTGRFNYDELVRPWLQACDGRVQAIPLLDRRTAEPVLHRFLAALDLQDRIVPLLGADDPRRVENRSPGPVAVEVSRRLRLLRVQDRLGVRPRELMRFVERCALERGLDPVPFKGVDPGLRATMEAAHADANARFAERLWGQGWSAMVAAEPPHPVNEIAQLPPRPEMEDQVQAILHEACARFGVRPVRPWSGTAMEGLEDGQELVQRFFRLSRWRVV